MNSTNPNKNNHVRNNGNTNPQANPKVTYTSDAFSHLFSETTSSSDGADIQTPPPPDDDGQNLVNDIKICLNRHLVLPEHADITIALWIIHTYIFRHFKATPYLLIDSPSHECGKTDLLTCLKHLASSTKQTSDLSVAILYRLIDAEDPTILLDEGRELLRNNKIRKLFRDGYKKGGQVFRANASSKTPEGFNTFCPKAIAQIGRYDSVLLSRGIEITMQRHDDAELENIQDYQHFDQLRERIQQWTAAKVPSIANTSVDMPEKINGRNAEIWTPLLQIANYIGTHIADEGQEAAIELTERKSSQREDTPIELLRDIKKIFEHKDCYRIWSKDLVRELKDLDEAPWSDIRLTPYKLAKRVRAFQISSKSMRINGSEKIKRGYTWEMFKDSFDNYLDD